MKIFKCVFIFLYFLPLSLCADSLTDYLRQAHAHLIIGDYESAIKVSQEGAKKFPDELSIQEMLLKAYANGGQENKLLTHYATFSKKFPKRAKEQAILEEIAWSVLKRGKNSSSITIRLASLIGSGITGDVQGMHLILECLQQSNCILRSVAIELTTHYGDQALRQELVRLFHEENSYELRLKVIQAIGALKMDFQTELLALIENENSTLEEKMNAVIAIANMRHDMRREEMEALAQNKRSGLRLLACEAAAKFLLKRDIDLIIPLVDDERSEVRASALKVIGLLAVKEFAGKPIEAYLKNSLTAYDPVVGITAAWVLLLADPSKGEEAFKKWINHSNPNVAALASSALIISGPYGKELALKVLNLEKDPFVKVNAAIALISQREHVFEACTYLFDFVQNSKHCWMKDKEVSGLFSPIKVSNLKHDPKTPNYPEVANQTVRLEVLNILAMMQFPKAEIAIKQFLNERTVGITGIAAELLLGEGDETALELVRDLLKDPNQHIRLQAALVLAAWGKDHSAIPTLIESYQKADRLTKIKILEAVAKAGSPTSITFLVERLGEDSQILRILAAAALILALNH